MWERYEREVLYKQVWEKPLLKLAQEYGVSAVALGKTCKKLSVPVPGRGYWARAAVGKTDKRIPLQKLKETPVVYRSVPSTQVKQTSEGGDPEMAHIAAQKASGVFNVNWEAVTLEHPIIRSTAKLLRRGKADDKHIVRCPENSHLAISVTREMVDRALRILAAIVQVLERISCSVEIDDAHGKISTVVDDQRVNFDIEEVVKQVVTQVPRVKNPVESWDYERKVTYDPTDKLVIHIDHYQYHSVLRKTWSDGSRQRLEETLYVISCWTRPSA